MRDTRNLLRGKEIEKSGGFVHGVSSSSKSPSSSIKAVDVLNCRSPT